MERIVRIFTDGSSIGRITMALPGVTVPLSLMATTVWAAFGLGNVGGFGMIIGRKVSPQPLQIR